MSGYSKLCVRALFTALIAVLTPVTSSLAQVSIEVKQGDTWTDHLSLSTLQNMGFRWKYEGAALTNAAWQITYTAPSASTSPVVKSVSIGVPAAPGTYSAFVIPATMIPADAPSTFYVRVRSTNGFSPWLPVSVSQQARSTDGTSPLAGALAGALEPARQAPTPIPVLPPGITLPPSEPAPNPIYAPLWIKLTKILCERQTGDGSPNDEFYAVLTTVWVNRKDMSQSKVSTRFTNVYKYFNPGDMRVPNLGVWGMGGDNDYDPILNPNDVIILVAAMESDGDRNLFIVSTAINSMVLIALNSSSPTATHASLDDKLADAMRKGMSGLTDDNGLPNNVDRTTGIATGDDIIGVVQPIVLSFDELHSAQNGGIVKKSLKFESDGKYELRFQMSRVGTSTVVW
jgi:hypothetical protein